MDERLDRRLVQVSQVRCRLPRLLAHDDGLRLDETEGIDDDFTLDGLDRVHDDGDGTWRKLFEGLLGVDIDRGEPAAETGVRVVPANNGVGATLVSILSTGEQELNLPARLLEHLHHLGLEYRINGLDTDTGTALRHGKDIHDVNRILIHELAQHQTHDFHRHTGAAVP